MKFRTEIEHLKRGGIVDYSTNIFTIGSCFAQNIAERLSASKFRVASSPLGILFNPASIADTLSTFATMQKVDNARIVRREEGWVALDCHSILAQPTLEAAIDAYNGAVEKGHKALTAADCVVITLGTAFIYEHIATQRVVANCHKLPQSDFIRRKLSVEEIVELFTPLLKGVLSNKQVIFTLSPIRHIADGLTENSLSKATLRVAIGELCAAFENTLYFPAYEIVMDDLRDYRFYADDLVHPSSQAISYIWEIFTNSLLTEQAKALLPRVCKVVTAAAHRPTNPHSEEYKLFCSKYLKEISLLPMIDFSAECAVFERFLDKS